MKKSVYALILMLIIVNFSTGCSTFMYGYTEVEAIDRYLLVDEKSKNFGFKRMQYNLSYNRSLKGFIDEHGFPDFIYEYKNKKGRNAIKMFYIERDIVYIYESRSWLADSLFLKKHRSLTEYEKETYRNLKMHNP